MSTPEPTITELITQAQTAIQGGLDKDADFVRGSDYEALNGPSAVVWSRQLQRDVDLFNATNFNTTDGADLTRMAFRRFGKSRVLDARGTGTARLRRPAGGIAETIWSGTHIFVYGSNPKVYRTVGDTPTSSTDLFVMVNVEALETGPGYAIDITHSSAARVDDILEDPTWYVDLLQCTDGTTFEPAEVFRTRIISERLNERVGQEQAIIDACKAAGAAFVVLFRSDYAGDAYDYGLNFCYVGNLGNIGTPELVKACTLALRSVRVAGDCLQVLPMNLASLDVSADVYLASSPALNDLNYLQRVHGQAVQQYLNAAGSQFGYSLDGLRTAITRFTSQVRRVVITSPSSDNNIVVGDMKNFPSVLTRYVAGQVTLRYL